MNYYDIKSHISNSDLGRLKMEIAGETMNIDNLQAIFDFGNLVDSMLLEPENLIFSKRTLNITSGGQVTFEPHVWQQALNMRDEGRKDSILSSYLAVADTQSVLMIDEFDVNYIGYEFKIPVRCKYDLVNRSMKIGADLKTTAAKTKTDFMNAVNMFDYDRQAAWYMDLGELDTFMFIAISKHPDRKGRHPIFHHAIERGDEMYSSGRRKYEYLSYMWKLLLL